jgi:hypothetical protein
MNKVCTCQLLIGIASGTESSKCTVIQRLLFKAGCMKVMLITDIKRKGIHDFFISESKNLFQYQCTDDHVHWSVMSRWAFTVEYGKRCFIDFGEYVLCKIFCPELFKESFFPFCKICGSIKETDLRQMIFVVLSPFGICFYYTTFEANVLGFQGAVAHFVGQLMIYVYTGILVIWQEKIF